MDNNGTDPASIDQETDYSLQLRHLMGVKHLSQVDLAKASGVSQPTIARILNGKIKEPRQTTWRQIRDAIDASPLPDQGVPRPPDVPYLPRAESDWGIQITPPTLAEWAPDALRAYVATNARDVLAVDPGARDHYHFAVQLGTDARMGAVWKHMREADMEDVMARVLPAAMATASIYGRIEKDRNPVGAQTMARWQLIHELKDVISARELLDETLDVLSLIAIGH